MAEIRTTRYEDGRWCEQEYENGKLHGRWTVFFANGQPSWERQYTNGRQEGYQRTWDEKGTLIEEQWYHLGELHGIWRKRQKNGRFLVVGDFVAGRTRDSLKRSVNVDFNEALKPYFGLSPNDCARQIDGIVAGAARETSRMSKATGGRDLSRLSSFWNHINVARPGEDWPSTNGKPLTPILQINCAEIPLDKNPLTDYSFVTVFAVTDDVLYELGKDIVVRAYRRHDKIVRIQPRCDPVDTPSTLRFTKPIASYPDENDLPAGLRVCLEDSGDEHGFLQAEEKLHSRIGGWPGWLQNGRISDLGRFAFQIDSLDVEGWECGDCTVHYFFREGDERGFSWHQEMC